MPAIPVHHTETSDKSWDGPANEARLKTDQDYSYYRRAYAWRDPEGDESNKSTYKFIHHEVDSEGNPGPANVRACITGIAVLNGARGGTTIPEADYQGVYNHLAAHLRDADVEPPELKRSGSSKVEHRSFMLGNVEIRAGEQDQPKIVGHAAVFNTLSEDLGFYREKIAPGAFAKTIQEADVRALFNHDPNFVLGRTKSGTLKLSEDEKGLWVEIIPPNTQWARDLMEVMRRGDVDQMSFGFQVVKEEWEGDANNPVRVLKEVKLYDVSPVVFPAYSATDVQVRSLLNILRDYLPAEPSLDAHSAKAGEDKALAGLDILRKRLEIAEKEI